MSFTSTISSRDSLVALSLANAAAHWVSYNAMKKRKAPGANGVLSFCFVNAGLAISTYHFMEAPWAQKLGMAFPSIGCLGLCTNKLIPGKGTAIDYVVFVLDIVTIWMWKQETQK